MRPSLVLNHSFLQGLLRQPRTTWELLLKELGQTLARVRRVRGGGLFHVHPELGLSEVAPDMPFMRWANQQQRSSEWRDVLLKLLAFTSGGPYYSDLRVDELACPEDTQPSCLHVPAWLRDMVLHCAHHVLSGRGLAWILSYGDGLHLNADSYLVQREGRQGRVPNLRNDEAARVEEARIAEKELEEGSSRTVLGVLEEAAKHAERVRVLPSAQESARRFEARFSVKMLFKAIAGLDSYAQALDAGQGRDQAASTYQLTCGIEMSQEKAETLRRPNLKKRRIFRLEDRSEQLFDMHAKPGDLRVHIFTRKEPKDANNPAAGEHSVVYIGHCGEHLPLK